MKAGRATQLKRSSWMNKAECWGGRGAEPITHKLKKEEKRSKSIQLPPSLCGELMECFSFPLLRKRRRKGRGANAATTNISITIEVNEMIGFALLAPFRSFISLPFINWFHQTSWLHQLTHLHSIHFTPFIMNSSFVSWINQSLLFSFSLSLRSIAEGLRH